MSWILDTYRNKPGSLTVWMRTEDGEDVRRTVSYQAFVYVDVAAKPFLDMYDLTYEVVKRDVPPNQHKSVLCVAVPRHRRFESFVEFIEKTTRHRLALYNADVKPEDVWLYKHGLKPFDNLSSEERTSDKRLPTLKVLNLDVELAGLQSNTAPVCAVECDDTRYTGGEKEVLQRFKTYFDRYDPDVIAMPHAFKRLPYLVQRLNTYDISVDFHRWDSEPITYKGGDSFYSYGNVRYHHFAIRLHGRFLLDTTTTVGEKCDVETIMEICNVTGTRLQQVGSKSFGAAFQSLLTRELYQRGYLIPYKEKPLDDPMSLYDRVKADQGGLSLDPSIGFHTDVAEVDFSSMFPRIIYNKNISAETITSDEEPLEDVPGIPISISWHERGIVPACVKPLLEARSRCKANPTLQNRKRSEGLKWILVTCYGYLRFREFKLGLASSHMAICAYARDALIEAKRIGEEHGYTVVHGIVDSLYIHGDVRSSTVEGVCEDIMSATGIPISCDAVYKWIVFLPSVQDTAVATPVKYYGVRTDGSVKARGVMSRKDNTCDVVARFQQSVLKDISEYECRSAVRQRFTYHERRIPELVTSLDTCTGEVLAKETTIRKTEYDQDVPQQAVVEELRRRGVDIKPGMTVYYVLTEEGAVLPDMYEGNPDLGYYRKQLQRSLDELRAWT